MRASLSRPPSVSFLGRAPATASLPRPSVLHRRASSSQRSASRAAVRFGVLMGLGLLIGTAPALARYGELPNHIPEAAPYNTDEAKVHPPPYDKEFSGHGNPGACATCHKSIFDEWNGSMMSNSWRDPVWRGAFLLIARLVSTDGSCDIPDPPDGTKKAKINPFANDNCTSTFDLGEGQKYRMRGSGSLLDGFCSRCHMPANYIDAVKPKNVKRDEPSGLEHGVLDADFDPTSARGTPFAFATVEGQSRNTQAGKNGITCTLCHTAIETRYTPFHNYSKDGVEYNEMHGSRTRGKELPRALQEMFTPAAPFDRNLGYGVGAGAYRVSPEAIVLFERFGPLSHADHTGQEDPYVSGVFKTDIKYQKGHFEAAPHKGNYDVLFERAEMCATCHDVTNPLTIKNTLGYWVGGFPIERTYTEWSHSRYADRPGNENFNPAFKRDCQACHMQQDYEQPGTAQTLYDENGAPLGPRPGKLAVMGPERSVTFSHHFVGGNTYSTRVIGANVNINGKAEPYPELSVYSYSSADEKSPYHNAYWENVSDKGPQTQHARFAWDRLRHALDVKVEAPATASGGQTVKFHVTVQNTGAGHNFPTGFPEGRNAWLAVHAFDVGTGKELQIEDSFWKRRSLGVGYLTDKAMDDPNFPGCKWRQPAGAPDPYAWQFRAVASLGDGCPTLELPYAKPLNMTVNAHGLPVDKDGVVIDRAHPLGLPVFEDNDGDGDVYDDAFLLDHRLRPMPNAGATLNLDRYSVVIPEGTVGPISVTAAVYYQSMEAVVAKKFMGNMADTDLDTVLEPCVLKGPCDGRVPHVEPAVVEGAPPVPVRVRTVEIAIAGAPPDTKPPRAAVYPPPNHPNAYRDVVPKVTASEPTTGLNEKTFTLTDDKGEVIPARVEQIGDFTWALFPNRVFLNLGKTYTAHVTTLCDESYKCVDGMLAWKFTVASSPELATGDTRLPPRPSAAVRADELAAPLQSAKVEFYVIREGDTLSAIAKRFYGDANAYPRLFEANREVIKNADLIFPGQKMRIP
jgi:nucleoid-associated protein YgaU